MVVVGSLVKSVSVGQWVSQRDGEGLEGKAERDSEKELGGWGDPEGLHQESPWFGGRMGGGTLVGLLQRD